MWFHGNFLLMFQYSGALGWEICMIYVKWCVSWKGCWKVELLAAWILVAVGSWQGWRVVPEELLAALSKAWETGLKVCRIRNTRFVSVTQSVLTLRLNPLPWTTCWGRAAFERFTLKSGSLEMQGSFSRLGNLASATCRWTTICFMSESYHLLCAPYGSTVPSIQLWRISFPLR